MKRRTVNKPGATRGKRRIINKDVLSSSLRQKLGEQRMLKWDSFFEKYQCMPKKGSLCLNKSEDWENYPGDGQGLKEEKNKSPSYVMKVNNWREGFDSIPSSSKDNCQPAEVDQSARANENIDTVENVATKPIISERSPRKSSFVFRGSSKRVKLDKKISVVQKDINQNVYNLRSRKNKEDNFEKGKEDHANKNLISGEADISKECQENDEGIRSFQNTILPEISQNKSFRVNKMLSESNKVSCLDTRVNLKKQHKEKGPNNRNIPPRHIPEEIGKDDSNWDLEFQFDHENDDQNKSRRKLDTSIKVSEPSLSMRNESFSNSARLSQDSFVNLSIESKDTSTKRIQKEVDLHSKITFEKNEPKIVEKKISVDCPEESRRAMSEWNTEFSNFIKYHWSDFQKNPGFMLFPLPKLKPSGKVEELSWESIMNGN